MTLAGWTKEEVLHEALVAPRAVLVPMPDTRVVERDGWWQLVTPSLKQGGLNEVGFSRLGDDEADAVIAATIAGYRAEGIERLRWNVAPGSAPADLVERLARAGLTRSDSRVMARATSGFDFPLSPDVTVERITLARVREYAQVLAGGWGMKDLAPVEDSHRRALEMPGDVHRLFLAKFQGHPAGVGGYATCGRSAYLLSGVVLPAMRKQGIYRALVAARLKDAAASGITLATTQAKADTSAPILAKLGFETAFDMPVFTMP